MLSIKLFYQVQVIRSNTQQHFPILRLKKYKTLILPLSMPVGPFVKKKDLKALVAVNPNLHGSTTTNSSFTYLRKSCIRGSPGNDVLPISPKTRLYTSSIVSSVAGNVGLLTHSSTSKTQICRGKMHDCRGR